MNKTEIISEIISALDKAEHYDKLMTTQVQPRIYLYDTDKEDASAKEPALSEVDKIVLRVGKKHIVSETVSSYWASVTVSYNDETGVVDVQSYDSWVRQHVKSVPDYISKRDFLIYFDVELRAMYDEKKAEAMRKYEEE